MPLIRHAVISSELPLVHTLFREHATGVGKDFCFVNFESELAELPGKYAPPMGRILLAFCDDELAGCVALRPLGENDCEMKRLYVRPKYRGRGIGRSLTERVIQEAGAIGYPRMCLDTLPTMREAIGIYRSLGFVEIEPYWDNPICGVVYLARPLMAAAAIP